MAVAKNRNAFTLIELLVVVSILAILMALSVGIIAGVRNSQNVTHTRQTVTTLQIKLNNRVTETIEKARSPKCPYRNAALSYCGGDIDLANSLLCYAYLKVELPESFMEATQGFSIYDSSGTLAFKIPASPRYASIPTGFMVIPGDQNAALLYLAVNDTTDDARAIAVDPVTQLLYYKDSFGNPIMFQRWYENLPMTNQPPYTNSKSQFKDPLDPLGKLAKWQNLPLAKTALGYSDIGDNNNKLITVQSSPMPGGEVAWGYQEIARKW